jgi:DNA-binding transcriptional LysR family regulator
MDFREFRYFVATAEELHFARAAERLGLTQPALSQRIKALESEVGARLFNRSKRRVELTEAGKAFLHEARAALAMAERAVGVAQEIERGQAGTIKVGYVGTVMFESRFPELLKAYRKRHPQVQLALHERSALEQIKGVKDREIDLAIVRGPLPAELPEGLDHFFLSSQRLVAVLPNEHALAAADSLSLAALAHDDFLAFLDPEGVGLGHALVELCRGAGFEPHITQRVSQVATLISLVAAGLGVSLMPESVSHLRLPGVRYVRLVDSKTRSRLFVVHRRFERSAAVREFLHEVREAKRADAV